MDRVFSHELHPDYSYNIYQPRIPRFPYRLPRTIHVEVTIILRLQQIRHYCLANTTEPCLTELTKATLCFDRECLKNHDMACNILGRMISSLQIFHPDYCRPLIDGIIELGIESAYLPRNKGRKILPIRAELHALFIEHVNLGPILRTRALEESALEFERRNYGMVPSNKTSVRKMLKRIRVEGGDLESEEMMREDQEISNNNNNKKRRVISVGEDCVICLDKLKVGSEALQMPCSHTFHGACITTWLDQSHYCPLCRFEMPTSSSPNKELSGPRN